MKALITGNAGFIGSHLADYLLEKGFEVYGYDNFCSGKHENVNPQVETREGDITNYDDLVEYMEEINPDYVFHLAAVSRTPWAVNNPLEAVDYNVSGVVRVLEAARHAGVEKVVCASSNIVYAAETPYKASKLAGEMFAKVYTELYELPTVCLRFANVYGSERQHEDNVLAALSKSKKDNGKIVIFGDGSQSRDFVHVLDVCRALLIAAESEIKGNEIDICTGKMWSLNEIAKFYDCPVEYQGERVGDINQLIMQGPKKAADLLGFTTEYELQDNISVYTDV